MPKLAFVFPGQASQYSGMGKETCDRYESAARIFQAADEALGFSLSALCFEGDDEALKLTENTQPAILTVSCAVMAVLKERGLRPDFVAGHSLGEYSALVAADALAFDDAVKIVRQRGRFMQDAVPVGVGAMAAILGADLEAVTAICDQARDDQVLEAANINCPGQIVIAGHKEAVARAIETAREKGFRKAILLPVSAPFHCPLMKPAQDRLAPVLAATTFRDPAMPLVTNVDAAPITDGAAARDALVRQVTGSVLWQQSIETLLGQGVDMFVEVGPKNVLGGMIKKISRDVEIVAVEKVAEIEDLVTRLNID